MPVTTVDVTTPDGVMDVTLHEPEGGPAPAVIFFSDAGGVRPVMQEMAARLASAGYLVAVPNLYYRAGSYEPFDIATLFTVPGERERMQAIIALAGPDGLTHDTGALLDELARQPGRQDQRVGAVGYCMGGNWAFRTAAAHPDRIAAAASFHGGRLAVAGDPSSPHLLADRITATVYVAGAAADSSFTAGQAGLLESALTDAGVDHTVEFYPARHGFAVPDNPTYDAEASARHWQALHGLYQSRLRDS